MRPAAAEITSPWLEMRVLAWKGGAGFLADPLIIAYDLFART
jgi:hypothetical protein